MLGFRSNHHNETSKSVLCVAHFDFSRLDEAIESFQMIQVIVWRQLRHVASILWDPPKQPGTGILRPRLEIGQPLLARFSWHAPFRQEIRRVLHKGISSTLLESGQSISTAKGTDHVRKKLHFEHKTGFVVVILQRSTVLLNFHSFTGASWIGREAIRRTQFNGKTSKEWHISGIHLLSVNLMCIVKDDMNDT